MPSASYTKTRKPRPSACARTLPLWLGLPCALLSGPALADEPKSPPLETSVIDLAVPLAKGEAAPFGGSLFSPDLASLASQDMNNCGLRVDQTVAFAVQMAVLAEERKRSDLEVDLGVMRDVKALRDSGEHFYTHPAFVAPAASVLTLGAVLLGIWALDKVTP